MVAKTFPYMGVTTFIAVLHDYITFLYTSYMNGKVKTYDIGQCSEARPGQGPAVAEEAVQTPYCS